MKNYYVYHTGKEMFIAGITTRGLTWVEGVEYGLKIKDEKNAAALTLFVAREYKEDNLVVKWS